jgi:Ca2+-binding RTX toxin-like protein
MVLKFTSARWGAAALVASAALVLAQAQAPEASAQGRCFGLTAADFKQAGYDTADFSGGAQASFTYGGTKAVAVIGSGGDDSLSAGTASGAVICGKGGADGITGSGLAAGAGPDQLKGGPGNDTVVGRGGPDLIKGGADNDSLEAGFGGPAGGPDVAQDTVNGGAGLDTCAHAVGFPPGFPSDQIVSCETLQP